MLEEEKVTGDRDEKEDDLLNYFIDTDPFGNFHAIGLGMYVIFL